MIYIYFFIMFISSSMLEFQYLRNQLSREFILSFLISISYTHIYNLYLLSYNKENLYNNDPIYLFFFFILFLFFFYLFLTCWLLFYIGLFQMNHGYIYFIE